jgi:hypothetical protein
MDEELVLADEVRQERRTRSLLALLALYSAALLVVIVLSDGADVGAVLSGLAGHVVYAAYRIVTSWRDASWLSKERGRLLLRRRFA